MIFAVVFVNRMVSRYLNRHSDNIDFLIAIRLQFKDHIAVIGIHILEHRTGKSHHRDTDICTRSNGIVLTTNVFKIILSIMFITDVHYSVTMDSMFLTVIIAHAIFSFEDNHHSSLRSHYDSAIRHIERRIEVGI